jgi:hypothetical protein
MAKLIKYLISTGILALILVHGTELWASSLIFVTDRSALGDTAYWSGQCFTSVPNLNSVSPNGVAIEATAIGGTSKLAFNEQNPPGTPVDGDPGCHVFNAQGNFSQDTGWYGDFGSGDGLVWAMDLDPLSGGPTGPLQLDLSRPVSGIGTQVQADVFGRFRARISVYDGTTLLGSFTAAGMSEGSANNSAPFLGVLDPYGADITSAIVSLDSCNSADPSDCNDFAINQVSLTENVTEVAEPSSITLLGAGLLGLALTFALFKANCWPSISQAHR